MPAKIINIKGKKFGRLTVLEPSGRDVDGSVLWLCQCECGRFIETRSRLLINGSTVSCGCFRIENSRSYNTYEIKGDITYVYDTKGNRATIDTNRLPAIKFYYWTKDKCGYFKTVTNRKFRPSIKLHNFIFGNLPQGFEVDHINRDKTDNRIANLRVATRAQNNINHNISKANNTGYTGVNKMKSGKYRAYITVNFKQKLLGIFDTAEQAYSKRLEAEKIYFGEFSSKKERR